VKIWSSAGEDRVRLCLVFRGFGHQSRRERLQRSERRRYPANRGYHEGVLDVEASIINSWICLHRAIHIRLVLFLRFRLLLHIGFPHDFTAPSKSRSIRVAFVLEISGFSLSLERLVGEKALPGHLGQLGIIFFFYFFLLFLAIYIVCVDVQNSLFYHRFFSFRLDRRFGPSWGGFGSGGFDSGRFDSGRFDSGRFDSGGLDSGGLDSGGHDSFDYRLGCTLR
jgi:hypothetical protein